MGLAKHPGSAGYAWVGGFPSPDFRGLLAENLLLLVEAPLKSSGVTGSLNPTASPSLLLPATSRAPRSPQQRFNPAKKIISLGSTRRLVRRLHTALVPEHSGVGVDPWVIPTPGPGEGEAHCCPL